MKHLFALLFLFCCGAANAQSYVFRDVNVLPMDRDTILREQDVVINNGIITAIAKDIPDTKLPKGATIIPAKGKFLMPGLSDMHVHLPKPQDSTYTMNYYLLLQLSAGITTTRSMRWNTDHLAARDSIRSGKWIGPDLLLSQVVISWDSTMTTSRIDSFVLAAQKEKYDQIKYVYSGKRPQWEALAKACAKNKIPLCGHVPGSNLTNAINYDFRTVEHFTYFMKPWKNDSLKALLTMDSMIQKNIYFTPTAAWYHMYDRMEPFPVAMNKPGTSYIPQALRFAEEKQYIDSLNKWQKDTAAYRLSVAKKTLYYKRAGMIIKTYVDRGGQILTGSDDPMLSAPGYGVYDELRFFVESGLTPYQALHATTWNAAACMNATAKNGSVTVGKEADLLLLDANPCTSLDALKNLSGVMTNGKWHTSAELAKLLRAQMH